MKISEIKIGEVYRVYGNDCAFAKVIEILPTMVPPNNTRATVIKCELIVKMKNLVIKVYKKFL